MWKSKRNLSLRKGLLKINANIKPIILFLIKKAYKLQLYRKRLRQSKK